MAIYGSKKEQTLNFLKKYLITKCLKDPNFKKEFLTNPKKTIENEFKIQIPDEVKMKAIEMNETDFYILIPSKKVLELTGHEEDFELSDQEMQAASGGGTGWAGFPKNWDEFVADLKVAFPGTPVTAHKYEWQGLPSWEDLSRPGDWG